MGGSIASADLDTVPRSNHLVVRSEQVPTGLKAFRLLRHETRMFIEESIAHQMAAPPFTGVGLREHEHS